MSAYYNEIDPAAAHILRALIDENVIAPGEVDTRSIKEVQPNDLIGFTQCHFFAGGGLWSVAARLAGWPDDEPLWTGSCPCQPFSAAGKGGGTDDPRHLWPDLYRLIRARRPAVVMGEQVAGAAGYNWFDGVSADLANENFSSRTVDFPACSVDAPHQRNRQWWVAVEHAQSVGWGEGKPEPEVLGGRTAASGADLPSALDDRSRNRFWQSREPLRSGRQSSYHADVERANYDVAHGFSFGQQVPTSREQPAEQRAIRARNTDRNGTHWSDAEWLTCHDGKARRTKPGLRLLVNGLPGRVDLWRFGGNAIVPEAAAQVIAAFIDVYGLPTDWRASA